MSQILGGLGITGPGGTGGAGGANYLWQATALLTDAQIKALPTTPVEIAAAPGANRIIVPVTAAVMLDATAGAYTADVGASWVLMWDGGFYAAGPLPVSLFLAVADVAFNVLAPVPLLKPDAAGFSSIVTGSAAANLVADIANKALQIKDDWNGVLDYTDGNAANTLRVSVAYYVFDRTTGLFIAAP